MPGELQNEYLSPWIGYYENRTPELGEWMDDERQPAPLKKKRKKKKNQNKMATRVVQKYLKKRII